MHKTAKKNVAKIIWLIIGISLAIHLLSFLVGKTLLENWQLAHEPFHSSVEMSGSVIALMVAAFLIIFERANRGTHFNSQITAALIVMGVLDGFHAIVHVGDSFVWLHSIATFTGSLFFVVIWAPKRWKFFKSIWWPLIALIMAPCIGICTLLFPDILPTMVQNGRFTLTARLINVSGGILLFVSAIRLVQEYFHTRSTDDILFCLHCSLLGAASIMFEQSNLWDVPWWGWHLLRFMAYLVAILFVIQSEGKMLSDYLKDIIERKKLEKELRENHDQLQELVNERTAEITETNEKLRDEITERKMTEKMLHEKSAYLQLLQVTAVAANEAMEIKDAFQPILNEICDYTGWPIGHAYVISKDDPNLLEPTTVWRLKDVIHFAGFRSVTEMTKFAKGIGLPGRVLANGKPFWIVDVTRDINFPRARIAEDINIKSAFAFPVKVGAKVAAVLEFFSTKATEPNQQFLDVMADVGTQLGRVVERKKAEEKLLASESSARRLIESNIIGVVIADFHGYLLEANRVFLEMVGYSREEVAGRQILWSEMTPTEYRHLDEHAIEQVKATGSCTTYEKEFFRKDGGRISIMLGAALLDGKEDVCIVFILDITERKLTEEELVRSRQKSLLHTQRTPLAVIEWNTNFEVTEWNPAAEKIFGYRNEEALGRHAEFIIHENAKKHVNEVWQNLLTQQGGMRSTNENITKDGNTKVCEWYNTPLVSESGEVLGVASLVQDITDKKLVEDEIKLLNETLEQRITKRTAELSQINKTLVQEVSERKIVEEALHASEGRLLSLSRATFEGIVFSKKGVFLDCNEQFACIVGYELDELIGTDGLALVHPEDRELARNRITTGSEEPYELRLLCNDNSIKFVEAHGQMMLINGERLRVTAFRDITERKKLEEEIIKIQKLESVAVLAGGIAHDFNNNLQSIVSCIALAKTYANPKDEIYRKLEEAINVVFQSKSLTQQLLTFSKGGEPVKNTICISKLIKYSANLALSGSNVRCELGIPDNLSPIEADKGQLSQAISNLIINANQAMPEGGNIKLWAENIKVVERDQIPLQQGKYVKISVTDQGTGISQEHLQKIFDPYFTTKEMGSGLGLATCYSIIKKHEGYITVESEMGVGTTFRIYLPASSKEIREISVQGEVNKNSTAPVNTRNEETPNVSKGKVLLMDDEATIRLFNSQHLINLKYEVETAEDGVEAIELYKKAMKSGKPFDAIIMDLTVPGGMGGREAIKKLLEIDPEVRAIVASGYADDQIMAESNKYGFSGVLVKPYEIAELDEELQKVIMQKDY